MNIIKAKVITVLCCFVLSNCTLEKDVTYMGDVKSITANSAAFTAIKTDGSAVSWGDKSNGGDSSEVSTQLSSNVSQVFSTNNAFAALKNDGSVVTWGHENQGGSPGGYILEHNVQDNSWFQVMKFSVRSQLTNNVHHIYSNNGAFAALKNDGSVVTWGSIRSGGGSAVITLEDSLKSYTTVKESISVSTQLTDNVTKIYSTQYAFAALKTDGSVVTWGNSQYGGSSPDIELRSDVVEIYTNNDVFVALKRDGSVITWGKEATGGDKNIYRYNSELNTSEIIGNVSEQLSSGVNHILSTNEYFAAIKDNGETILWGSVGDISNVAEQLTHGVIHIFSYGSAFAAIKSDGSAVSWKTNKGRNIINLRDTEHGKNVSYIFSNPGFGFLSLSILKSDGSLFTIGEYELDEQDMAEMNEELDEIKSVVTTYKTYVALKVDGSVITWGKDTFGFKEPDLTEVLSHGVVNIFANEYSFVALKENGLAVTWESY